MGCRVQALHQCIDFFSPFGFQATRLQLRRILSVTGAGWTDGQLINGLSLLEQARASWVAARDGADVRTYQPENRLNRPLPDGGVMFPVWLAAYLGEDANAERWGVADIGACTACGHLRVVHRRWACLACLADTGVSAERSCQFPSPLGPETQGAPSLPSNTTWFRSLWAGQRGRRRQRRP